MLEPRCEICGAPLPDAELSGLLMAEEIERQTGVRQMQLLCPACFFHKMEIDWDL